LRFDDSLETVLSADMTTPLGAASAWRQLVDLIGRRRAPPSAEALARLETIRGAVPATVRAASARGLEHAAPPVELVCLFAADAAEIAAPVLRGAQLTPAEWIALLPALGPRTRSVLRHRRDLDPAVVHALTQFGTDFALAGDEAASGAAPAAPYSPSSFVSLAEAARGLPAVARALREGDEAAGAAANDPGAAPAPGSFQISELVARIAAYQRQREETHPEAVDTGQVAEAIGAPRFRFETDAAGIVRWVEGVNRAPLIGLSLDLASSPAGSRIDGVAVGAFRRRAAFANARLVVTVL
jgi:hypothetical protein